MRLSLFLQFISRLTDLSSCLVFVTTGILVSSFCHAQDTVAARLYNAAVVNYNMGEYRVADELFTKSIKLVGDRDTYFSRGLCRGKMADQQGFCLDMAHASVAGHSKAKQLFTKGCGSIDSSLVPDKDPKFRNVLVTEISFKCKDTTYRLKGNAYHQRFTPGYDSIVRMNELETDTSGPLIEPEFPGGINEARKFLVTRIDYPSRCREEGITGKVYVHFDIYEDGTIRNIRVRQGIIDCIEFSFEVKRLIATMPRWIPAKKGKKLMKAAYNLPISFNIQH